MLQVQQSDDNTQSVLVVMQHKNSTTDILCTARHSVALKCVHRNSDISITDSFFLNAAATCSMLFDRLNWATGRAHGLQNLTSAIDKKTFPPVQTLAYIDD